MDTDCTIGLGRSRKWPFLHDAALPSSLCWGECQPPCRGMNSHHRADWFFFGVVFFFPLDEEAGPRTMQLCFGAAQLCSFCCHVGEMGQSVQPGTSVEVGLGHAPAAPVMEEPCSHRDPGTIGPSAPLEVPATTVCAEMYNCLKTRESHCTQSSFANDACPDAGIH